MTKFAKSEQLFCYKRRQRVKGLINKKEIIPELLQGECNSNEIYKSVRYILKNPSIAKKQLEVCNKTLDGIRSKTSSADEASSVLLKYLS